jgi:hypothetical protein
MASIVCVVVFAGAISEGSLIPKSCRWYSQYYQPIPISTTIIPLDYVHPNKREQYQAP